MTDAATHPTTADLDAFVNGRLPRVPRAAVERHIERCDACLEVLKRLPEGPFARLAREAGRRISVSDDTPLPGGPGLSLG